jgi:hypothetical protein
MRAFQQHQPPARQALRQRPRHLDRDLGHAPAVRHQHRSGHARQKLADVGRAGRLDRGPGDLWRDRRPDLVGLRAPGLPRGPAHPLMRRRVGEQVPVLLDQAQQRLSLPAAERIPATGRPAEQHHPPDALRMARGVGDGVRAGVVLAHQADLGQPGPVNHRLQVRHHRLERQVADIPLRVPRAPPVVVDHGKPASQLLEHSAQQRVLPLHPQAAEGHRRQEHQRRAGASDGKGQAHAVRAARIADPRQAAHGRKFTTPLRQSSADGGGARREGSLSEPTSSGGGSRPSH